MDPVQWAQAGRLNLIKAPPRSNPATGSQAVERALAVLDCFVRARSDLGVNSVARELGLSPSTVHRLVRALAGAGYVEQSPDTNRYYLGRSAILLGQAAQHNLGLDMAHEVLEELSMQTGESVNLGVRDGDTAMVVLRVQSRQPLRFDQPVGSRVHLHASSMGKALLAFSPDPVGDLRRLGPLAPATPATITDPAKLAEELAATRERGYSIDNEEGMVGVRCVGAPVLDQHGRPRAAVAIQVPAVRMPPTRAEDLGKLVINAANRIQDLLPIDRRF